MVPGAGSDAALAEPSSPLRARPLDALLPAVAPLPGRSQLRALTTLRFVGCFAVFLHHCVDFTPGLGHGRGVGRILWEGWSGVSFFFVLSGFILAFSYGERLRLPRRGTLRAFYVARLARIYPLFLLTFAIAAIALAGEWGRVGVAGIVTVVSQLTLTQALLPLGDPFHPGSAAAFGFDGPAWTLSCEAYFCLSFPLVLRVLWRRSSGLLVLTMIGACGFALLLALGLRGSPIAWFALYVFPPVRWAEFLIGVCGGVLFMRVGGRLRGGPGCWTALEAGTLGLVAAAVASSFAIPVELRYAAWYLPFFTLVVLVFAAERGRISQAMRARWLVFLGELSFAFYLLHVLILRAAVALGLFSDGLPAIAVLTGVLTVGLASSALVLRLYERPLRARVRGWLTA